MSQPLAGVCVLDFSTLPVPVDSAFRRPAAALAYPALGEDNELIGG